MHVIKNCIEIDHVKSKSLDLMEGQDSPPVTLNGILKNFIFDPSIGKIGKTYESKKIFLSSK